MAFTKQGWIGVDLDGTLAHYDGWIDETHIGMPIRPMQDRVMNWLAEGQEVRIFTARVSNDPTGRIKRLIQSWSLAHLGAILEVTCSKDYAMIELWDDRAIQVKVNEGTPITDDCQYW